MSNPKEFVFEEDARQKLQEGIDQLAQAVSPTLGPRGKHVALQTSWGLPKVTDDGNTIVQDLLLEDPYANIGLTVGKEMARKVQERAGDGTTRSIVLLQALVREGMKYVASGYSPIFLKRGMEKGLRAIIEALDRLALPAADRTSLVNIATVAASGDQEMGETIASAVDQVGLGGVVTVEEGRGTETVVNFVEGMRFDRGYISPYFCTDMEKMTVEMADVALLVVDKKVSAVAELLPFLQSAASTQRPLLIIAEDVEGDLLPTLIINNLRKTLRVVAVKAPSFGDQRRAILEDIAVLTGATVISEEKGMSLHHTKPQEAAAFLGRVGKLSVTKNHTTLVDGAGSKEKISARMALLDHQLQESSNAYDRNQLMKRKATLQKGVAVIQVGGMTEAEVKQKVKVFESSLCATLAAREGGYVCGGGIALIRAAQEVEKERAKLSVSEEEWLGVRALLESCSAPFCRIVENSGQNSAVHLDSVLGAAGNIGFNASTGKIENLMVMEKGEGSDAVRRAVIDPNKVVKEALECAVSAATTLLLTEVLIVPAAEESA